MGVAESSTSGSPMRMARHWARGLRVGQGRSRAPFSNLECDLSFKRACNTFGDDPALTSQIGAAGISGIQLQHVMALAKHFIGSDAPGERCLD
jgi:beta-glucosidase-like glycosyl hydrolase